MNYWIVFLVSMVACSVGFRMYIWFFSVGYGLAVSAIAVALAIMFIKRRFIVDAVKKMYQIRKSNKKKRSHD